MDPVTAFGLACNVLTVLDLAVAAGKELKDLYDSSSGYTKATQPLLEATKHLTDTVQVLKDAEEQFGSAGSRDQLRGVAKECALAAESLNAIVEKCKVRKRQSVLSAAVALGRSAKSKSEIVRLQQAFEAAVDRLRMSMEAATRVDIGRIVRQLDQMSTQQADVARRLDQINVDLASGLGADLPGKLRALVTLSEEALSAVLHEDILKALRPATASLRFDEIKDPEPSTFTWMLGEEVPAGGDPPNFYSWLASNSPIFHIIGRPGSGKSTLLKYLVGHETTRTALGNWARADGKGLLVAKFFFWKLGVKEQKTYNGMMRGLLYDVVVQNADATRLLFPKYWRGNNRLQVAGPQEPTNRQVVQSLSDSDVATAFQRLITEPMVCQKFNICFFIDGLDEFDEADKSHWFLATCLKAWTGHAPQTGSTDRLVGSGNIKLCVSSREYDSLMSAFSASDRLMLHELTNGDISGLVANRLGLNEHFVALSQACPQQCEALVQSITDDAKGVFLWVVLLIKVLEEELASGTSSVDGLRHIVQTAPSELDEFIQQILETIPKHRQQGAYLLFAIALRLMGWSISRSADQDPEDIVGSMNLKPKLSRAYAAWTSCLTSLPLAVLPYLFDTFEKGHARRFGKPQVPEPRVEELVGQEMGDRDAKMVKAQSQLVSWSRSLLEPVSRSLNVDDYIDHLLGRSQLSKNCPAVTMAVFTHRSIPEVLIEILRHKAGELQLTDARVAKALLKTCLAETMAGTGLPAEVVTARLMFVCSLLRGQDGEDMVDIFAALDELDEARTRRRLKQPTLGSGPEPVPQFCLGGNPKQPDHGFSERGRQLSDATTSSDIHYLQPSLDFSTSVLTLAADAGYAAYLRWKLRAPDPGFPDDNKASCYAALWGVVSAMCDGRFTKAHGECLALLLRTGVSFDAEMAWGHNEYDEICRVSPMPPSELEESRSLAHELDAYVINRSKFQPRLSPWLQSVILFLQAFLRKTMFSSSQRLQLWQAMELWLGSGARPAGDIQLRVLTTGDAYSGYDYMGLESFDFKWSVSFTIDGGRQGVKGRYTMHDWAELDRSVVGQYADEAPILSALLIPLVQRPRQPISFADIVRYWRPPNMETLLGYLEPKSLRS